LYGLEQTIRLAITRLRRLIFELGPLTLENEGLATALRAYLDQADETSGTTYRLEDRLATEPSEATTVILYRIAQEILTSIRKHAHAENATVTLETRDGGYYVRIHDDGIALAPEPPIAPPRELGFAAIRERAELAGGWLRIESTTDHGTTVEFWIASDAGDAEAERTNFSGHGGMP
jgi:signal transduction histidine kinase